MPFVSDIVGPQQPVQTWPPLDTGALRRTSTIDTHPAGTQQSDVELRARDAVACLRDTVDVLAQLVGNRVGPGFRATVGTLLPEEVTRASLLHLILDDWVGASLVSGYGVQHAAITQGIEEKMRPGATAPFRRCMAPWLRRSPHRVMTDCTPSSHCDRTGCAYEYTVAGSVDTSTRTIMSVSAVSSSAPARARTSTTRCGPSLTWMPCSTFAQGVRAR
jgi:hypothetical protein